MDCMDIDQVVDVPDTPDRIAAQNINDPSVTNTSVNKDFSDEGSRIRPRDKSKLFTDNGSKRPLFPPSKNLSISNKSSSSSGKSSSSKNPLPKRMVGDKTANHETKHSIHSQPMEKGKYLCTSQSQSSTSQEGNPVVDLTEQKGHFREHRKGPVSANSGSSLNTTPNPITSRRVAGQKRLVRNGCISPHNIAKAKQSAEVPDNSSIRDGQNDSGTVGSNGPLSVVNIRDLVAEANDSHRVKGKGIINYHLSSRSTTDLDEKADETIDSTGDASRFEGLGGWRSTRNRHLAIGKNDPSFVNQQNENGLVRRENRDGRQMGSHNRHQSGQFIEHKHSANALIKRQKQGSTSSNHGECFTPGFDDSELVCIGSSGESSSSRSTGDQSHHRVRVLEPVIEIDEFSPEIRNSVTSNAGCSSNDDSDVRARQVETDEMLARELQEELYNEVPGVGVGEIDARVALALQQEENLPHAFPSGTRAFPPRSSLRPNPYSGQSVSLSSRSPSVRRGTQARVPTSTRMARLRGRFPGQSRTISSSGQSRAISSRERSSMFPPSMDYEMRMHILQTLEAFNDMEMAGDFSRIQRDFNENDYEMLLALDENNHQHGGASLAQINGLPQSVVQTENLEEACAICLDTPSTGDTIRHLPCLHRFHKDCIDPWLQRKTSCPVCKSSIT